MQRSSLRVVSILLLLVLAIFVPLVLSGYSEWKKASTSKSYEEAASHYKNAAQRIPWHADLYELAGHEYYYAKEYPKADTVYQKAFQRGSLSSVGWVAWGDVLYLNGDAGHATQIWERGLAQKNASEDLYSRLAKVYKEQGNYSKAAEYLQKYVSLHSDEAAAHYRLGLLLTLTDPKSALSELISASELDPQLDPAVETLHSALDVALQNEAPSQRFVLIGRGLGLIQEWEMARIAFESAIKADAQNAEAWAWLGEAKQQALENGTAELDRAFQLN